MGRLPGVAVIQVMATLPTIRGRCLPGSRGRGSGPERRAGGSAQDRGRQRLERPRPAARDPCRGSGPARRSRWRRPAARRCGGGKAGSSGASTTRVGTVTRASSAPRSRPSVSIRACAVAARELPECAITRSSSARNSAGSNGTPPPLSNRQCSTRQASSPAGSRGSSSSAHSRSNAGSGPGGSGPPRRRAAARCRTARPRRQPVRVVEQQQLHQQPAHRHPDQVRSRHRERVEHGDRVRGQVGEAVGLLVEARRWTGRCRGGRSAAPDGARRAGRPARRARPGRRRWLPSPAAAVRPVPGRSRGSARPRAGPRP